jgi:polyketide synthase PksL
MLGRVEAHRRRKANKPDVRERARALCAQGEWEALGLLWVGGQDVSWDDLRSAAPPRKLPLPTYPFARDRYWVESGEAMRTTAIDTERVFDRDAAEANTTAVSARPAALHPLIAQNVSTLRETAFLSMLDADAFYGRDHRVDGAALFPGACYLEMACATGAIAGERSVLRIEDAVWMQPLPLGAAQPVKTVLRSLPGEDGNVAEFFVASYDEDNAEVIHCEGRLRFGERPERTSGTQVAYRLDELLQRMPEHISGEECYRRLRAAGFDYGPTFRTLQVLHVGDGAALAELRLDDSLHAEASRYLLHPCLIDGALQSALGAATGDGGGGPYLPFAIGEIEILRPLPNRCRVYVERRLGDPGAQPDVVQFDLRILADNGEVLVRINRFYVRASRSASARTAQAEVSA